MSPLDDALRFAGLALAHAAWIASDLEQDQLICPIAITESLGIRQVIPFEANTQEEAVQTGLQKTKELVDVDRWAFIREGLITIADSTSKTDVIMVSSWSKGIDEPITVVQGFARSHPGPFRLVGPPIAAFHGIICEGPTMSKVQPFIEAGIASHPQGKMWMTWSAVEG